MAGSTSRKRSIEEGVAGRFSRPTKKFKKQVNYQSSSSEEEEEPSDIHALNLQESGEGPNSNITIATDPSEAISEPVHSNEMEEATDGSNSDSYSNSEEEEEEEEEDVENSNPNLTKKRKRNDPEAFATSMSKILGSKLASSKRADPVLSRSADAIQASKEITDLALEKKAKQKIRAERREALDKGRVRDVLGASTAFDAVNERDGPSVQEMMELEKRLRKTAQRGVVKLFNAVRAAQIKGEEAAKDARVKGLVGQGRREEKVNEMSKQGFLDLIAGGGGKMRDGGIQEA